MNKIDYRPLLEDALSTIRDLNEQLETIENKDNESIAVIGIGCRLPGNTNTADEFWELLSQGKDAVTEIPTSRWNRDDYYDSDPNALGKTYVKNGAFLNDPEQFDASFFGMPYLEATMTDPQQRLLLEVTWEALENAGIAPDSLRNSRTGVFTGLFWDDYSALNLYKDAKTKIDAYRLLSSLRGMSAGRVAYVLGLQGPVMQLDTACSSSLSAVHLACQSLLNKESNLALAGGVSLFFSPEHFIGLSRTSALSPDGRCKAFDASADGFGLGEGCGTVVLKRLSDAIKDEDNILAVIKGSAVNHDGASNGLTAPNGQAQESVIRDAIKNAAISPEDIQYIEAHGTGTELGDPIEMAALANVFSSKSSEPVMIGSVKANIGHLTSSAGVASLIKVILALKHKQIPPQIHFTNPNPHIPWADIPFTIATNLTPWRTSEKNKRRIAGVSSFGMTGTNVHLIVAEAPEVLAQKNDERAKVLTHLLTLSAKTEAALRAQIKQYATYFIKYPALNLADVCYTTNVGRAHFDYRIALTATTLSKLQQRLDSVPTNFDAINTKKEKIVFLFTGQGSQYADMGRELFESNPLFRQILEQCNEILKPYLDLPLLDVLYGEDKLVSDNLLAETRYTQPALFAIEYALARVWQSWGIEPDVVLGHSIGEYPAACIAGVFTLEEGLKLIAERSRLMQSLPEEQGGMIAVQASEQKIIELLNPFPEQLAIAVLNAPQSIVLSGQHQVLDIVSKQLTLSGIQYKSLNVSHAFHSPLMKPILAEFKQIAETITYTSPKIELISNLTGTSITEIDALYWTNHIQQPVQFISGMKTLFNSKVDVFIEIGPKPILTALGQQCLPNNNALWLPSLRPKKKNQQQLLESLAALYVRGVDVNWQTINAAYPHKKVVLPTYPFQRQVHFISQTSSDSKIKQTQINFLHPLIGINSSTFKEQKFTTQFTGEEFFFSDHLIADENIFPGVAYIEMARAAGAIASTENIIKIKDIVWMQAISLQKSPKNVYVYLYSEPNHIRYELVTIDSNDDKIIHGQGKLETVDKIEFKEERIDISAIEQRCTTIKTSDEFYQVDNDSEIFHGVSFQVIKTLSFNETEALSQLVLPEHLETSFNDYVFHPSLTDGALQTTTPLCIKDYGHSLVPFSMTEVEILHPLTTSAYAYAQSLGNNKFNISLVDDTGLVCVKLAGFSLRPFKKNYLDFCYMPRWESMVSTRIENTEIDEKKSAKNIIVFYPDHDHATELANIFAEFYLNDKVQKIKLSVKTGEGLDEVLENNFDDPNFLNSADTIYFLGGIISDLSNDNPLLISNQVQEIGLITLFKLIKAINQQKITTKSLQLKVLTNNSCQVGSEEKIIPYAASMQGLCLSAAKEYPTLKISCIDIDLMAFTKSKEHNKTIQVILEGVSDNGGRVTAIRDGKCYTRNLYPIAIPTEQQTVFKKHGVYFILGGAGGVGFELAKYLAKTVNAKLILIGRSPLTQKHQQQVTQIQQIGGDAIYLSADAQNPQSMQQAVLKAKDCFGVINGAIHSALALNDKTITLMDDVTFRAGLASKIEGSINLREVLKNEPLDFMLFFSSVQSFEGNLGQANYAAASNFEDSYALYLAQTENYPVRIINWGYWGEVGTVASEKYKEQMFSLGFDSLNIKEAMQAIEKVLDNTSPQIAVVKAEERVLKNMGIDLQNTYEIYPQILSSSFNDVAMGSKKTIVALNTHLPNFAQGFGELENFAKRLIENFFISSKSLQDKSKKQTLSDFKEQLGFIKDYDLLFEALLDILRKSKIIKIANNEIYLNQSWDEIKSQKEIIKFKARLEKDCPEIGGYLRLLSICIKKYDDILNGRVSAVEVIFPNGSVELVEGLYKGNPAVDYFNEVVTINVCKYVSHQIENLAQDQTIRILEIGAGTGGTSAKLLKSLNKYAENLHYTYTDISERFSQYGNEEYGNCYPFAIFDVLNIEEPPEYQGYELGSYDIIVATNVLHATKDIQKTIYHVKKLLKTNGLLVLNETTARMDFLTLTFGLLKGWWLSEDKTRIPYSPMLDIQAWKKVLNDEGFEQVDVTTQSKPKGLFQDVIIAQSNGIVKLLAPQRVKLSHESKIGKETNSTSSINKQLTFLSADEKYERIKILIQAEFSEIMGIEPRENKLFSELGADSLIMIQLSSRLSNILKITLAGSLIFEYPSVALLATYLVESVLEKTDNVGNSLEIKPVTRNRDIPLSFVQEELWLNSCSSKANNKFWSLVNHWKIKGRLDLEVFERSFNLLAERHELLRTTFPLKNGIAIQKITSKLNIFMPVSDLSSISESRQLKEIDQLIQQEMTQHPLDLMNGPIWKVRVVRFNETSYNLLVFTHHIIMDASSIIIFFSELFQFYEAELLGKVLPLTPLSTQYADFSAWQRKLYTTERLTKIYDYYQQLLSNISSQQKLPTDKPRTTGNNVFPATFEKFCFPIKLTNEIKDLTQKKGMTTFTVMLSVFVALLYRYTACEDIVVDVPMSKRFHKEVEGVIGDFSGKILIRVDIDAQSNFSVLLNRVQKAFQSAVSYQELSYKQVINALNRDESTNLTHKTPAKVMLNFLPAPVKEIKSTEIISSPVNDNIKKTMFLDLVLFIWEESNEKTTSFEGGIRYRTDLFERETILNIIENFQHILSAMILKPEQLIKQVDLNL